MWGTIAAASSGLTLVAFIVAGAVSIYRRSLIHTENLIEKAPEDERAKLIKKIIEDVEVDTSGLTKEQRYQLAVQILHTSSRRFLISAIVVVVIAVLTAVLAAYAINRNESNKTQPTSSPLPSGTLSVSPSPTYKPTPSMSVSPKQMVPTPNAASAVTKTPKTTDAQPEPTLHPDIASNGNVDGYVYDAETQEPIKGAVIIAKNEKTNAEYQTATNNAGHCEVVVPAGSYSVTVSRDGYIKNTQYCKTSYGSACGVFVRLVKTPK